MSNRDQIKSTLQQLRLLGFDWNGAGGLPLRGDVADTVFDILDVGGVLGDSIEYLPPPTVKLNGDGTIEAAFDEDDGRQLLLTFQCDGVVTYIKAFEDEQTTVEGVIRLDSGKAADLLELADLLDWLTSE